MHLDDILSRLNGMPEKDRQAVIDAALKGTDGQLFVPNPGPQTDAFFCQADELFYGGQAGGGKSALAVGLAVTNHTKSLILRRYSDDARALAEDELIGRTLDGDRGGWNAQTLTYRLGERLIDFGGVKEERDKQRYKGRPHDLIVFDEVTDFLESQYVFITAWNRTTTEGQVCRVVATGNPPTTAEGLWVIRRWAAWLDPKHPNPAKYGELRWYTSNEEGKEIEVNGPGPHLIDGKEVRAKSRTFIPAALSDNPDLARDGEYEAVLSALPKELRDAYRDGKFDAGLKDNPWQLIPTEWVRQAMERWTEKPPEGVPMCAIGVDVAQGGDDNNVIAPRHDGWYAPLESIPGSDTPLGTDVSGVVVARRRDGAVVIVDCGGGYGGTVYTHLKENGIEVFAHKGSEKSVQRTKDKQIRFFNRRSEVWWRFREALDPSQPGGSPIMLPDDNTLLADLTAPHFEVVSNKIKVTPKERLVELLGRSPDDGDAVVMAWAAGPKMVTHGKGWEQQRIGGMGGRKPKVLMGRQRR